MGRAVATLVALALLCLGHGPCGGPGPPLAEGNLVHACEGFGGLLRLVRDPSRCGPRETPLSWQKRGGLRLLDASGRDLGRLRPDEQYVVRHDPTGLSFEINSLTGGLEAGVFVVQLFFAEVGCQGTAHISFSDVAGGTLIPDPRQDGALLAVTNRVAPRFAFASRFTRVGGCRDLGGLISQGAAEAEPFVGDLGFSFPLPVPLRVTAELPPSPEIGGTIEACVGRQGLVRRVRPGDGCRRFETPEAWLRLGGLRVFDGTGHALGLLMWRFIRYAIYVPEHGVWFDTHPLQGLLGSDFLFFAEPGCQGAAARRFGGRADQLVAAPAAGAVPYVDSGRRRADFAYLSSSSSAGCREGPGVLADAAELDPFEEELGFEFPLTLPLTPAFPGATAVDPDGEAPGTGVVRACVGLLGQPRFLLGGGDCLRFERSFGFERRGGLRVKDAAGADLGAYAATSSRSPFLQRVTVDDTTGLRVTLDDQTGDLGVEPFQSGGLHYENADCSGRVFASDRALTGLVIYGHPAATPTGLLVGTSDLVAGAQVRAFSQSLGGGSFSCGGILPSPATLPGLSTELAPFEGELPFAVPVAAPPRVRVALP
jgi:hypothetical protein